MNQTLKDKCALVTGGSRGIGAAIVKRLASEGANVALTYSNSPDRATEVVEAAQASAVHPLAIQAGSADAGAVLAAVERTVSELGGIDILVNNAGIAVMGPPACLDQHDRGLVQVLQGAQPRFSVGLRRMAEEVVQQHLEDFERFILGRGFQAMDEGDQRRQTACRSKPGDRGNLGRTGKAGEGGKTRRCNVYRRRQPDFQATNVLQSLEGAHQRGPAPAPKRACLRVR